MAPNRSTISLGVPASWLFRSRARGWPMAAARRSSSASSRPQQTVRARERRSVDGSRPAVMQAASTFALMVRTSASGANGTLNSSAYVAASRGVVLAPSPPTMTGGCGSWNGRGSAGFALIE